MNGTWDDTEAWTNCPSDCGQTAGDFIQTRNIYCTDTNGSVIDDSYCTETKPDTSKDCPETESCETSIFFVKMVPATKFRKFPL